MILRSIEVEGFRCFDRMVRIDGFAPGLNVLHGPNGAGKSTLLRALQHALVDAYSLSGGLVKQSMTPWGRALGPRIRVAFSHEDTEWRMEKRFLMSASARLERRESGEFRPVADGKAADQQVREMLQADGAAKGIAKDVHLGLLQVLWTPQGSPLLPDWSAGVRTTLQEAFGAALSSRAADELGGLVAGRYEQYFTGGTGKMKKSSPVAPLELEEARLREEAQALRQLWQSAGVNRETLVRLRARIAEQAARQELLTPQLASARAWQGELSDATAAELQARSAYEALDTRVRQWRADIAAQQQAEAQREAAVASYETLRQNLTAAQALQPELERLERELELLQQNGIDAKAWPEMLRHRVLSAARAELAAQLAEVPAPSAHVLQELRQLHQNLEVKQAALDAASLKMTLEAEAGLVVESGGETHALAAGQTLELASPQSVSLRLPGVARITAASANAQATGLADEVARLRAALQTRLAGETLGALEERFVRRDRLQREFDGKNAELRPLLARAAEFAELQARHPDWGPEPPDIDAIRAAYRSCRDGLEAAKSRYNLPALSAAEAAARTKLETIQAQLAVIVERLAQLAAYAALEMLEQQRRDAEFTLTAARTRLQAIQAAKPADPGALEQSVHSLLAALDADRQAAARLEGELAAVQSQNLYSRLAETEERLSECAANLERQRRRAAALQLLHTTIQQSQRDLSASLPEQIAEFATANWRRIAGAGAPAIHIGESWTPAGLRVSGETAALHELSGGEAEQVAFATRLALATQLAQSSRQLAVFDDSFLATDPARAGRIVEMLAEAAEKLQILILTCHPGRYAGLADVREFDLEKLKQ